MAKIAIVSTAGTPEPYKFFGIFAALPFWPGGLTLLASAPGIGKTSWLLRMIRDAGADGIPAMIGCYEHTPEELKYRMHMQSLAAVAGPHEKSPEYEAAAYLAEAGNTALVQLDHQRDTVRALEEIIIQDLAMLVKDQHTDRDFEKGSVALITDKPISEATIMETIYGSFCYCIVVGDEGWHEQEIHYRERGILSKHTKESHRAADIERVDTGRGLSETDIKALSDEVKQKINPHTDPPPELIERM